MDAKVNRKVKDSVFTNLFARKEYTLKLYKALFPDDTEEITEDDIDIITIENVLLRDMYNDLGIRIKNKLIILAEAPSSWSQNITFRMFMYLASVYKEYIIENKVDLYTTRVARLPEPELFVIYTGDNRNVPEVLSLADTFFKGKNVIDLKVKVITDGKKDDIIFQYIAFTKVINQQIKRFGYTKKAITETLNICKNDDILKEYLIECEKEVIDMLDVLFDHDFIMEAHNNTLREEAQAEGRAQGMAQGMAQGVLNSLRAVMTSLSYTAEQAMDVLNIPANERQKYLSQLQS